MGLPTTHTRAPQVGLATLSAAVQRSGGSTSHPGAALDEALEERAASIEGGAGGEAFALGWQCLREDAGEVLGLFAEVVLQPALPQDKLDLAKSQVSRSFLLSLPSLAGALCLFGA
jgi:zinc protease